MDKPLLLSRPDEADKPISQSRSLRRVSSLDGLRGLAILAVVLFHFPTHAVVKGGLFGVGIFFVLSGFLITKVLGDEQRRSGCIRLGRFFAKRAWRLVPALAAFLLVLLVATAVVGDIGWFTSTPFAPPHPGPAVSLRLYLKGALAAVTFCYNMLLAHPTPSPTPPPLDHLWTLAVEVQFYVIWGVGLYFLLRRSTRVFILVTAAVIVGSFLSPFLMWHHGEGQNLIYFSTVPRLQQLLAGALIAKVSSAGLLERFDARALRAMAFISAAVVGVLLLEVANVTFKYLGAFTVVGICTAVLLAHLIDGRVTSSLKSLLSRKTLVWLGQRSYAIYLWHWPFAEWTNEIPHSLGVPFGLALSLVAGEISWRLIEQPALKFMRSRAQGVTNRSEATSRASAAGS